MIYLLYGGDFKATRKKLNAIVDGLQKRRPESGLFKITDENFLEEGDAELTEFVSSQGLFGGSYVVVCENVFTVGRERVVELLPQIKSSNHVFIFLEGALNKKDVNLFKKNGAKIEEYNLKPERSVDYFNIFSLADALANKDRKKIWVLYQKALRSGLVAEQIQGTLFWQLKTMIAVSKSGDSSDLNIKPFVLNKAKRALNKWEDEELVRLSREMVSVYHEARKGGQGLEHSLEKLLLSI